MLGVLIAMHNDGRTGLLLPLFPAERVEYLEEQERIRKAVLPPEVRDEGEPDDEWPKFKTWPTCKTCGREMFPPWADDCGGDCSTCVGAAEAL
jgi:hypothetical protein